MKIRRQGVLVVNVGEFFMEEKKRVREIFHLVEILKDAGFKPILQNKEYYIMGKGEETVKIVK